MSSLVAINQDGDLNISKNVHTLFLAHADVFSFSNLELWNTWFTRHHLREFLRLHAAHCRNIQTFRQCFNICCITTQDFVSTHFCGKSIMNKKCAHMKYDSPDLRLHSWAKHGPLTQYTDFYCFLPTLSMITFPSFCPKPTHSALKNDYKRFLYPNKSVDCA